MHRRFHKAIIAVVLLLISAVASPLWAADGYKMISTTELKNWLQSATPPTLIYSLSQVEFEEQRIPGSICIPMELMSSSTKLPTGKDRPLVFYCKGPG